MDQEEIASLTLEYLKRFDNKLERIEHDLGDVKFRLRQVEETLSHNTTRYESNG